MAAQGKAGPGGAGWAAELCAQVAESNTEKPPKLRWRASAGRSAANGRRSPGSAEPAGGLRGPSVRRGSGAVAQPRERLGVAARRSGARGHRLATGGVRSAARERSCREPPAARQGDMDVAGMLRRLETKLLGDVGRLEAKVDDLNTHVNTQLAPLQKNRRDLEQGLRGLTELSQDVHTNLAAVQSDDSALKGLAQELKDQQELQVMMQKQ